MFYEYQVKGEIRNLRQEHSDEFRRDVWKFEIFLDDREVFRETGMWWVSDRVSAIKEALKRANAIKAKDRVRHELATVGDRVYVKYSTDINPSAKRQGYVGYYGIFKNGKPYTSFGSQSKEEALEKLAYILKHGRYEMFALDHERFILE